MRIVSTQEMRELERRADASGYSYIDMMEEAGRLVAKEASRLLERVGPGLVLVLIGPGNNGGDGLVAARYLAAGGAQVRLFLAEARSQEDRNWAHAAAMGIPHVLAAEDEALERLSKWYEGACLVIDALLGVGARPPLRGTIAAVLEHLRKTSALAWRRRIGGLSCPASAPPAPPRPLVLAVDVPSGLDADTGAVDDLTLQADVTVAIGLPKWGHVLFPGAAKVGRLVVADIGLPEPEDRACGGATAQLLTGPEVAAILPPRPPEAHKGSFGSVLVVAGSANYVGAAVLAAAGAARSGCGLVTLASIPVVLSAADALIPEATRIVLPSDLGVIAPAAAEILQKELSRYQVMLIGPGLTTEKPARELLFRLLEQHQEARTRGLGFVPIGQVTGVVRKLPRLVLDADALNLLAGEPKLLADLPSEAVLTPHPGEMARLLGQTVSDVQANRVRTAQEAAQRFRAIVVLKGAFTIVASPDGRLALAPFANPALATGGTGDVLAGTIAGLMAQGMDSFEAACAGTFVHGLAAEAVRATLGSAGALASDLLPLLPQALRDLRGELVGR
jgi:NAD(P)H-hydrate epimerase